MDFKKFTIPQDYVEKYVYQYVGYVKRVNGNVLNGCCPFCHEGSSWGKKRRFFYDPTREGNSHTMKCYNCGFSATSINFIKEIAGLTFHEIKEECKDYDVLPTNYTTTLYNRSHELDNVKKIEPLPQDCINLTNPLQLEFYKDEPIVKEALRYIKERKLDVAPNRPKTFYISLSDFVHKNRLVIPYYDDNKVVWYQTRKLLDDTSCKYLSKAGGERSLFNVDQIDMDIPYIFMFEGAIDCMFVKNATCVSGITEESDFLFTKSQQEQLLRFPMHKIVWVLDSPYQDEAARKKIKMLTAKNELVFNWPKELGERFKDFNQMVVALDKKKVSHKFILKHTLTDGNNLTKQLKFLIAQSKLVNTD